MLAIDRAITEAQAEETAEREVKRNMERNTPAPVNNVTISLDDYLNLYNSTDKYCRLLAIISGIVEPCTYSDGMRLSNSEEILDFIKFNEMHVYADMLTYTTKIRNEKRDENDEKRGEDV